MERLFLYNLSGFLGFGKGLCTDSSINNVPNVTVNIIFTDYFGSTYSAIMMKAKPTLASLNVAGTPFKLGPLSMRNLS